MSPEVMKRRGVSRSDIKGTLNKEKYSELQNQLERMKLDYGGSVDEAGFTVIKDQDPELGRQIRHMEMFLAKNAPKEYRSADLNKLNARRKWLEEKLQDGMPTYNELWQVPGRHGYKSEDAVRKEMAWQKSNQDFIQEWKDICKTLDPGNPNAGNTETLRKEA